ncbi:MAG: sigma-70 family RNA polymerase sigma factor [Myxococcales bacterium]|nr:sigma-70 family RNA polymerase sigma factor [Myxococcales bacterium]MCB9705026.1 sigma-70 family RNA polymerase sigma factor [Myxococcales bacterium]
MTAGEESSEADDAALVRCAAARGLPGQLAFEKLVDRHQLWLVGFLKNLLGSQSDAEDIAQDAFVRAFLAIEECGDGARFRGWLRVIARRLAFNYRRDARTRARYEERSSEVMPTHTEPVARQIEGRELLHQVLGELAYPYREIMVLRFVEELPVKEIAQVLEIGESAAKMRLQRARGEFQRIYEKRGGQHGDAGPA